MPRWWPFLLLGVADAELRVAVFSNHDGSKWSNSSCTDTSRGRIGCNLQVYEAAIAAAAAQGASLLVMPEGYGLSVSHAKGDFFEPWISTTGSNPHISGSAASAPQQVALSAAAAAHGIALVANIFVSLPNGTKRIADVVYDRNGTVLAGYFKHHLFLTEGRVFDPGPFKPTSFVLDGTRFGLIICYEGLYPSLTGDWSQMEGLKAEGASAFTWSVGGMLPLGVTGGHMAKKFNVSVIASENKVEGQVLGTDGKPRAGATDVGVSVPGYMADKAAVRISTIA